jgi:predicted PurR-regulated permease PerM
MNSTILEKERLFTRRVLVVVAIVTATVAAAAIFLAGVQVFLLAFAGILLAVFLHTLSGYCSRYCHLSHAWSLALVIFLVLLIAGGLGWFMGATLSNQASRLAQDLPRSFQKLEQWLRHFRWGQLILGRKPEAQKMIQQQVPQNIGLAATTLVSIFGGIIVIFFLGIILAAAPGVYRAGLLHLIPKPFRSRISDVLDAETIMLRRWLTGKVVSMAAAGLLTAGAMLLLKIPLALTLGILAALGEFVPNFGPILAALPAVLLALLDQPIRAAYVAIAYIIIQTVQSYFIQPYVQQKAVDLPMALIIIMQVLMGVLFGPLGLALATPLAAVGLILVKMLYVEDVLGDQIEVRGESK